MIFDNLNCILYGLNFRFLSRAHFINARTLWSWFLFASSTVLSWPMIRIYWAIQYTSCSLMHLELEFLRSTTYAIRKSQPAISTPWCGEQAGSSVGTTWVKPSSKFPVPFPWQSWSISWTVGIWQHKIMMALFNVWLGSEHTLVVPLGRTCSLTVTLLHQLVGWSNFLSFPHFTMSSNFIFTFSSLGTGTLCMPAW